MKVCAPAYWYIFHSVILLVFLVSRCSGGRIIVEGGYRALLYTLLIMGGMELLVAVWRYLVAPRADAVSDNSA
jgi:hypothetical protein